MLARSTVELYVPAAIETTWTYPGGPTVPTTGVISVPYGISEVTINVVVTDSGTVLEGEPVGPFTFAWSMVRMQGTPGNAVIEMTTTPVVRVFGLKPGEEYSISVSVGNRFGTDVVALALLAAATP